MPILKGKQKKGMDEILKCPSCHTSYNTDTHSPRILPCDQQQCLACIEAQREPLGAYAITCKCVHAVHRLNKLDDMPVSQATLFCMNKSSHKYMLEQAKFDISQHYDGLFIFLCFFICVYSDSFLGKLSLWVCQKSSRTARWFKPLRGY